MELSRLRRRTEWSWVIEATGPMRVPVVIFGGEALVSKMDQKAWEQASNVAALPGIQESVFVMPDAHSGYGFAVGGVAAFDADQNGVVSAGGVGFDISCGVRTLLTGLKVANIQSAQQRLADALARDIPAGLGGVGSFCLEDDEIDAMLLGGAKWAVDQGYGTLEDLIESRSADAFKRLLPNTSRAKPSAANATRWGHWARGTIISKSKKLPRSSMMICHGFWPARGRGCRCDSLRIPRAGPPDRHRLRARDEY